MVYISISPSARGDQQGNFRIFQLVALVHTAKVERRVNFDDGGLFLLVRFFSGTLGLLVVESCFVCES